MSDNRNYNLPPGWVMTTLDRVAEIRDDLRKPVNADERATRAAIYPYYGATGQVGWIDQFLMDGEYVLLGEDGAPFLDPVKPKAYIVSGKSWVNNHAHVLKAVNTLLTNRYLTYWLNTVDYRPFVNGTTRLKLTQGAMKGIPVQLPSLSQQCRIVAEIETQFSRLDAGIAALKRVQSNLKRYRAAALRTACEGRLVPTEAELARQEERKYEPADVLLKRIEKERATKDATTLARSRRMSAQQTMELESPKTDLGPLPEGWAWSSLKQIAEIQGGIQKQPSRMPKENAYPFLRVANVLRGRLALTEIHQIELFHNELDKLRLEQGDLLIVEGNGSSSEIGRMAIWNGKVKDCVHQNHIIRARPVWILPHYIEAYWNSPLGSQRVLHEASSTSGLHTLSVSKVGNIPMPIPPLAEQERIVAEVERRLSLVEEVEAMVQADLKRGERLRQAILQQAFSGKLVPQDPNDEPASVLLERIKAERESKAGSASAKPQRLARSKPAASQSGDLQTTLDWEVGPQPPDPLLPILGEGGESG